MKLNTREAIIGIITYRVLKHMVTRKLTTKGGIVATKKKKAGIIAAIGALIGALFFWRQQEGELGRALIRAGSARTRQGPDLVRPRRPAL